MLADFYLPDKGFLGREDATKTNGLNDYSLAIIAVKNLVSFSSLFPLS